MRQVSPEITIYLIHDDGDGVVIPRWSAEADKQIKVLGGWVTLDLIPGLGHGIDEQALRHAVDHLLQK